MGGAEQYAGYASNPQYNARKSMFELNPKLAEVIFVGDSITQYGNFDEFFGGINILNRGIGSDTTEGVLHRTDEISIHQPSKIFIMIGINDLVYEELSLDWITDNVREIIEVLLIDNPNTTIYLQSVLPTVSEKVDSEKIIELNKQYKILAGEFERCEYIDVYSVFLKEEGRVDASLFSSDGVHINGKGYEEWIKCIEDLILEEE